MDQSSLYIRLTLDFISDITYGAEFNALLEGKDCRIMRLLDIILPELMKYGFFPLRSAIPILSKMRKMYHAIAELRLMAQEAIESARKNLEDESQDRDEKPGSRVFDILIR
jgi:hypothetical protein